jgi:hypothetical protein
MDSEAFHLEDEVGCKGIIICISILRIVEG